MSMICGTCGGICEWRGWSMSNFTHTECRSCGARNNQLPEPPTEPDEDDEFADELAAEYSTLDLFAANSEGGELD